MVTEEIVGGEERDEEDGDDEGAEGMAGAEGGEQEEGLCAGALYMDWLT